MPEAITLSDIYDKNLNFLIGSGASVGLFPTLALRLKNAAGEAHTLESLATWFEERNDPRFFWLFMHYYTTTLPASGQHRRISLAPMTARIAKRCSPPTKRPA